MDLSCCDNEQNLIIFLALFAILSQWTPFWQCRKSLILVVLWTKILGWTFKNNHYNTFLRTSQKWMLFLQGVSDPSTTNEEKVHNLIGCCGCWTRSQSVEQLCVLTDFNACDMSVGSFEITCRPLISWVAMQENEIITALFDKSLRLRVGVIYTAIFEEVRWFRKLQGANMTAARKSPNLHKKLLQYFVQIHKGLNFLPFIVDNGW